MLNVNIEIENSGEDAHGTTFKCILPTGTYYSNVVSKVSVSLTLFYPLNQSFHLFCMSVIEVL